MSKSISIPIQTGRVGRARPVAGPMWGDRASLLTGLHKLASMLEFGAMEKAVRADAEGAALLDEMQKDFESWEVTLWNRLTELEEVVDEQRGLIRKIRKGAK